METPTLSATYRTGSGTNNAHRMRNAGQVPAVVYDPYLNKLIGINKKDLDNVLNHYGDNALINIQLGEERIKSLVSEVQHDPVTNHVVHVDFKPVNENTKVRAHIPIKFIGTEYFERSGGILQRQKQEIEVECIADKVPKYIKADLSTLGFGQSLKVQDLEIAEELSILTKPHEVIATLTTANNYVDATETVATGNEEKDDNQE